jgi:iron complex transport system substrate-binding protein
MMIFGPQRIVCLTEETTECLYLLGQDHRIVGISGYTVRPRCARDEKPKVSPFLSAKIDKILTLKPDCVFGFSDLQADIAALLIRADEQVTVINQRSVDEIFSMLYQVAVMVDQVEQGLLHLKQMRAQLVAIEQTAAKFQRRPIVYFEQCDESHISCIRWVSELIGMAGGDDCFPELAQMPMGKDRIIADGQTIVDRAPDIITGSICGKKFHSEKVSARKGWQAVQAVLNNQIFEIKSANILQPGPAALTDGVTELHQIIKEWESSYA